MKACKLIESYSAQPTIEERFELSLIIKVIYNSAQVNSGQFNLFLQLGLISSFLCMTSSAYAILSNKLSQILPTAH